MKTLLFATTLLLAAFPSTGFSQDTPPKLIPELKAKDSPLSEVVAMATEILGKDAQNVIYYDDAQKVIVPEIHVKNVSMEGLLNAIGAILPAQIDFAPNPGGQPSIVVRPIRKPEPAAKPVAAPAAPAPPQDSRATLMLPIPNDLKSDAIIDLIRTAWTMADPNWEKSEFPPKILFHVETRTLLIHARQEQGNVAVSSLDAAFQQKK
jgi:hypothetical protein